MWGSLGIELIATACTFCKEDGGGGDKMAQMPIGLFVKYNFNFFFKCC